MLHRTLDNGTELVIKELHMSKMVAIQCWVGVGSLHEQPDQYGMAHVLEHMLFKGTKTRGVGEISRQVEAFGGEINAFTTFDQTVFYLTLSSEHTAAGLDILSDAIFNSAFDETELKREQEVILEEIRQSNDSPAQKLGRAVFERIYGGTPAARPIIGYAEGVSNFQRDDVDRFHKSWYHPKNMKVVIVGDVDTRTVFPIVEQKFGTQPSGKTGTRVNLNLPDLNGIKVEIIRGDYSQPRIEVAFSGPALEDPNQVDLDLAAFALGSGDSSRLNRKLRDDAGVVSSIGCSLYSPAFGGIFGVSAIPAPDKIQQAIALIGEQLQKIANDDPITEEELQRAVVNLRADQLYQDETVSGVARSLGYSLSTQQKTLYETIYEAKVRHATRESVTNAVKNWVTPNNATIVLVVPDNYELQEEEISQSFQQAFLPPKKSDVFNTLPLVAEQMSQLEPSVTEIKPGIKLVYRHHKEASLFSLVGVTEGGLRADGKTPGLHNYFANLLGCANHQLDYLQLLKEVEGTGTILAGFSGKDSTGLKLQCFEEKFHHMTRVWADCLLSPVFPERQWKITQLEVRDEIRSEQDFPANIAVRKFQKLLYGSHPYSLPIYGTAESLDAYTPAGLEKAFGAYRDGGDWVIGAVGSLEEAEVREHLQDVLGSWEPSSKKRDLASKIVEVREHRENLVKDKEQSHVVLGFPGVTWYDEDRYALDILSTILGGSGGRFFINLRDRESLAYNVSPVLTYGVHQGAFGAYIACSPEKVEQAISSLQREFDQVINHLVSEAEMDRAKNYLIGSHESEMQRGDAQALTMALMELYGVGYADFLHYSKHIKSVKPSQVLQVAKRIVDFQKTTIVTVGSSPTNA